MPTKLDTAPMTDEMTSIRANDWVSSRAMTGGMTSIADTKMTPRTCIVASTDVASTSISRASMRPVATPDTSATSGSNVTKSSER